MIVGQGPTALAVGAGGGCLDIFTFLCPFSPLSPSLWETTRYRLKHCLKGLLNSKQPATAELGYSDLLSVYKSNLAQMPISQENMNEFWSDSIAKTFHIYAN